MRLGLSRIPRCDGHRLTVSRCRPRNLFPAGRISKKEKIMLEITSHRNGEVLNHNHGRETADALLIEVRGIADPQSRVTVNGRPAIRCDREFRADVPLTEKIRSPQ